MHTLTVSLSDELKQRLETLASDTGKTVEECLSLAVSEFVETWEQHLSDIHQIDEDEVRTVLNAVNE